MNDYLKVNSKTDILEFKRKHNLLVENGTIKANVSNIKTLSNDVINNLRCGDVVLKEDSTGKHAYLVSFKSDTGLCLTYCDAYCVETQSYDKVENNWVYNSEDKTIIAEPKMENIVDKDGHKRFIEGNINSTLPTGTTQTYGKWSLSGSHLLMVLCLTLPNATTYAYSDIVGIVSVPQWILDKIRVIGGNIVSNYAPLAFSVDGVSSQSFAMFLRKTDERGLFISCGSLTTTAERNIRVAFDLLIDNAEPQGE